MSKTAHIIAVRKRDVQAVVGAGIMGRSAIDLLMTTKPWIGPRQDLETDFDFLQIIPYIVIRRGDEYLAYTRGVTGGEDRLHGKISIGIGGHVDGDDAVSLSRIAPEYEMAPTLYVAMRRELEEEIGRDVSEYVSGTKDPFTHVIQTDASEVDQVHLGVVAIVPIPTNMRLEFEDTMENVSWLTLEQLQANQHRLETWSVILVDELTRCASLASSASA